LWPISQTRRTSGSKCVTCWCGGPSAWWDRRLPGLARHRIPVARCGRRHRSRGDVTGRATPPGTGTGIVLLWGLESLAGFVRKVWRVGEHAPPILLRNCQPHTRGKIAEPTRLPPTGVRTDPLRGPTAHVVGLLPPGWNRSGNHGVPARPWCYYRSERKAPLAVRKAVQLQAVLAYDSRLRGAGIQPFFASHHLGNPGSVPERRALPILLQSALSAKRGGNLLPTGRPLAVEVTVAGGYLEWSQRRHPAHPGDRPRDLL
jgi:hypothetical protein